MPDERLLTGGELADALAGVPDWQTDGSSLTRVFEFSGFKAAMAFANRVADAANAANHHPDIHVEGYKTVRIVLTTHAVSGLSPADFDLAAAVAKTATVTAKPPSAPEKPPSAPSARSR